MITDEMLQKAAQAADEALTESISSMEEDAHEFSEKFEKKMKKLIWKTKHPVINQVRKAAACILMVLLAGGSTVLAFSSEARNAFMGWIREQNESYVRYHFTGEEVEKEKKRYQLGYIPDGYQEIERYELESENWISYSDKEGRYFHFLYMDSSSDDHLFIMQQEQLKKESATVAGKTADF